VASREATLGELLKETLICADPSPPLAVTSMSREALEERPSESVTVRVRVWVPGVAGAVHEVEAAEAEEKEPADEDQV
jgi:hypothetical protein